MRDLRKKTVLQLILFRILVATILIVAAVSIQFGTSTFLPLTYFYLIIVIIYILSLFYLLLYSWGKHYSFQIYLQIIPDLILITALVYISGGLQGTFYFLYILEIITASLLLSGRAAYLTAAMSSIFFGVLVDLMYFGVIPYYGDISRSEISAGIFFNNIFVAWGAFFLIAFLINYLTKNLKKTKEALDAAKKELEIKKNLALAGDVAAHLAHEIRNPLAAISGSVQVLGRDLNLAGEQKDLMQIIVKESRRISQSFEHFLTLASPGKSVLTSFRLSRLMNETLTLLQGSGEFPKNIKLEGNFRTAKISYYGSDSQFKQIFWNILKNSIKAMPGGGTLTINFKPAAQKNILMEFSDTGSGMSREEREKVFEPFHSGFEKGQGIGMSVVRRIVGDYNGRIDIDSTPGKGTKIMIFLPPIKKSG